MEDREEVSERYGSRETWRYRVRSGAVERERTGESRNTGGGSISDAFKTVFLPQGYPESVSADYLQYQLWDTVQAFCSSLSGTLATRASLKGVGVGDQGATVAAATMTWLLKDGTGMLGRILFAWSKGSKLDSDAKRWRLFADVLNDVAMFVEIVAPHFPPLFTLIVCIAGLFKSIVGVAGGATRAALTVHQARRNNMADVSAKDGSQETLVNLVALLFSMMLIQLVADSAGLTFALFFLFTALHLFANYRAVRAVVMETLNEARLAIVLRRYLRDGRVLTPAEANRIEPVFPELRRSAAIRLGVRLGDVVRGGRELERSLRSRTEPYLLGIKNGSVCVCLGAEASVRDQMRAACQAVCVSAALHTSGPPHAPSTDPEQLIAQSHRLMEDTFPAFVAGLEEAGWRTDVTLLDWDEWRAEWSKKSR